MTIMTIGLVTDDDALRDEVVRAFDALAHAQHTLPESDDGMLDRILRRGVTFLADLGPPAHRLVLVVGDAAADASLLLWDARAVPMRHATALLQHAATSIPVADTAELVVLGPEDLSFTRPEAAGWRVYSDDHTQVVRLPPPGERGLWALTRALDHAQRRLEYRIGEVRGRAPVALARLLHDFLREHHFSDWTFSYLTGSPIAGFIQDLERLARATGAACLRGPSEHGLAAGAFAMWNLHRSPFVIAVTKGMMDEFKGTLTNLRNARARGFFVAVEDAPGTWFGMQAAITTEEDVREVLAAHRLHCFHLHDPDTLVGEVERAFQAYHAGEGPVVLLVTPELLGLRLPEADLAQVRRFPNVAPAPHADLIDARVDELVRELNEDVVFPVWHVGAPLSRKELRLLLDISKRAGIALASTTLAPGAVPDWQNGEPVPLHLGTLGTYTFREVWHRFVVRDGLIDPATRPGFLRSRISGMERPFTDSMLRQHGRILQVTEDPAHHAPFAQAIGGELGSVLAEVSARLDVRPDVLAARQRRYEEACAHAPGIVDHHRTTPMTTNYFLERLGQRLRHLVTSRGHDYRVVIGASRTGFAAANHLPMTKVAHSGLIGRALMGDALMALPALAFASDSHLVVCVGDGERNLVPDVVPALIENHLRSGRTLRHNVSIFIGFNNAYSMIETFISFSGASPGGTSRQAGNVNITPPDTDFTIEGMRVVQRTLVDLDTDLHDDDLTEPARVNIFPVLITHNDSGDGMTLQSMRDWRYRTPVDRGARS